MAFNIFFNFILIIFIIQQLDGNVIGPHILGDSIGVSALWVVISTTLCGGLFGYIYGNVVIKNLTLENVTVTATEAEGAYDIDLYEENLGKWGEGNTNVSYIYINITYSYIYNIYI